MNFKDLTINFVMKPKYEKRLSKYLKKYWGFDKLKDKQYDIISNILEKKDVVGLLPTGYGKSLTYLLPPLLKKKAIFIISPLISLMEDQKEKLVEMDIPVATLHSNNSNKDRDIFDIIDGKIKIVYMSPEYLISGEGMDLAENLMESKKLGFFAVDESHCISQWGHDFRPQYTRLSDFREKFPKIPILAVTATATENVVNEIINFLKLKKPQVVTANFDRPNLYIKCVDVKYANLYYYAQNFCLDGKMHKIGLDKKCIRCHKKPTKEKFSNEQLDTLNSNLSAYQKKKIGKVTEVDYLLPYIKKYENERVIIYTNSRKETSKISDMINDSWNKKYNSDGKYKVIAGAYHAGLSKKLRERIQEEFSNQTINVIVTTIAFGMGIDQTVRCVLIVGSPSSIEAYYQQIGRAGRDGKPSEVVLFFQLQKLVLQSNMINKKHRNKYSQISMNKRKILWIMKDYFMTKECRRRFILKYFGQNPKMFWCNNCDNCCERKLIDMTDKIYNHLVSELNYDLVFTDEDKQILLDNKIYEYKFKKFLPSKDLLFWKKILKVNKIELEKIPNKLRLKYN